MNNDAYRQLLIVRQSSLKVAADLAIAGKLDQLEEVLKAAKLIADEVIAIKGQE